MKQIVSLLLIHTLLCPTLQKTEPAIRASVPYFTEQALAPRVVSVLKFMARPGFVKYAIYTLLVTQYVFKPTFVKVDYFYTHVDHSFHHIVSAALFVAFSIVWIIVANIGYYKIYKWTYGYAPYRFWIREYPFIYPGRHGPTGIWLVNPRVTYFRKDQEWWKNYLAKKAA